MRLEESYYLGYDGTRMFMNAWLPDDDRPRALLILIHGLGSHGLTLRNIGQYFGEKGYAVFAPDMRGFGHYQGLKGHVMRFDEYVEDVHNIVMQTRDRYHNKLAFLYGHSLGGQHVIRYAAVYPREVDGVMIACPGVSESLGIPVWKRFAGEILSVLNVKRYFSDNIDFQRVSHDPAIVEGHIKDKLRFDKVTARFGVEGLRAAKWAMAAAPQISLPALVQQAGDDMLVEPEKTKEFFDRLGSSDKTLKIYDGLYHEIYSEIGKEQVLLDMDQWLEQRLPE